MNMTQTITAMSSRCCCQRCKLQLETFSWKSLERRFDRTCHSNVAHGETVASFNLTSGWLIDGCEAYVHRCCELVLKLWTRQIGARCFLIDNIVGDGWWLWQNRRKRLFWGGDVDCVCRDDGCRWNMFAYGIACHRVVDQRRSYVVHSEEMESYYYGWRRGCGKKKAIVQRWCCMVRERFHRSWWWKRELKKVMVSCWKWINGWRKEERVRLCWGFWKKWMEEVSFQPLPTQIHAFCLFPALVETGYCVGDAYVSVNGYFCNFIIPSLWWRLIQPL